MTKRLYPWREWFNRDRVVLKPGDYGGQPHGMAQQIRNAAKQHGVSVSLSINDGTIIVRVVNRRKRRSA